jgi:hypothetical protein
MDADTNDPQTSAVFRSGVGAARDRMEREKRKEKKTTAGR